ncbi:unnamed protein product, partial [marine sediment metagenome]
GKPTRYQKILEKTLTGWTGFNRFLDLIYPNDNKLVEEAFKKYIYDKSVPSYPDKPYKVEFPHRTFRFSLNMQTKATIRKTLSGMEGFFNRFEHSKEGLLEKEIPPGSFGIFL